VKLRMLFDLLVLSSFVGSCTTGPSEKWQPRIYIGAPEKSAIHRQAGQEVVSCAQEDFSDYLCMSSDDLSKLYKACLEQELNWKMADAVPSAHP
jgi:hypothetical protein